MAWDINEYTGEPVSNYITDMKVKEIGRAHV